MKALYSRGIHEEGNVTQKAPIYYGMARLKNKLTMTDWNVDEEMSTTICVTVCM